MSAARDLLILGAGEEQLPLYREARRRGLRTVAVDRATDRPALTHGLADEFLHVSTHDADAIGAAFGDRRPAAVVSAASDACLPAWHELTERYELPYRYPRLAARASLHKAVFHALARDAGVPGPAWAVSADLGTLAAAAADLRPPLIVKPEDGNGSRGVTLIPDADALPAAFGAARAHSRTGDVLVEEYIDGRQLVVELFLRDGTPRITAVLEKRFAPGPGFVVSGHLGPTALPGADRLARLATRIGAALGIRNGPCDFDVIAAPDGTFVFIEGSGRAGGNGIPLLLRSCYGVDSAADLVALALGEPVDPRPGRPRPTATRILASPADAPGELVHVSGLDEVRAIPGVRTVAFYPRPGDRVLPYTQAGHKIGHLVATGGTVAEAAATADRAAAALRIVVAPPAAPTLTSQGEPDAVH